MELKRPRPLDDPPAASSSEEEEEESQSEPEEEDEVVESEQEKVEESEPEEDESEDDDDNEEEDEKKNTQMNKTPISAINDNPQSSSSETDDSDSQKSPRLSDFTIKPIAQPQSVEQQQTPVSKPGKRKLENGKASEPKKAKAGAGSGEEESCGGGGGGKKGAINRLWSEEDEIDILKGVVEFQSEMGKDLSTHQVEFYEFMKGSLRVEVSKSQLMDKVRRLKKKYRNNVEKSSNGEDPVFSKPHDYKCFQLSKKIWGNQNQSKKNANANDHVKPISSKKNSAKKSSADGKVATVDEDHVKPISAKKSSASDKVVTVAEDHVKPISSKKSSASDKVLTVAVPGDTGCDTKEENFTNGNGEKIEVADGQEDFAKLYPFLMNGFRFDDMPNIVDAVKSGIRLVGSSELKELDSKWKKLSMEEVEISLKRMDLMQELTRMVLDAMKSFKS